MRRTIESATARWDTWSNPDNCGWVVDIKHLDGRIDTIAAAPSCYHDPENTDKTKIIEETLRWEGLNL